MILSSLIGYAAALLMGLALGLTGGGGSILTVPILVYLFGVSAYQATAYSLGIVGTVALWGAISAYKNRDLHLKTSLVFGVPGVFGVMISRKLLLPNLPAIIPLLNVTFSRDAFILALFSVLMLLASISMIRSSLLKTDNLKKQINSNSNSFYLMVFGLLVGLVAGFVGAGGGFLIVPSLVKFANLDMKKAISTSLMIISMQSLLGLFGDFEALKFLDFKLYITIVILSLFGMTFGGKLRHRISNNKLELGFGLFVLVMGIMIFIQQLIKGDLA